MIATTAEKNVQQLLRSCGNHFLAIASGHSNHMETSLYGNCSAIKVATTAQLFMETSL